MTFKIVFDRDVDPWKKWRNGHKTCESDDKSADKRCCVNNALVRIRPAVDSELSNVFNSRNRSFLPRDAL